jgi:hypothetical protein
MPGKRVSELTRKAIERAYRAGEGSYPELAQRFSVSEATIKRICRGVKPGSEQVATAIVQDAIAHGTSLQIGGLNLTEYIETMAKDLRGDMASTEAKSKEGVARVLLGVLQFYAEVYPPTLDQAMDALFDRPDFDLELFTKKLRERYANQKAG